MVKIAVAVAEDHLERLGAKPLAGLLELIWNAFDADATDVSVEVRRNELDGVESVLVRDNGHGMSFDEAKNH